MPARLELPARNLVQRYRMAQTFHELAANGVERSIAARQVSIQHGVQAEDVLASAAEFGREPLWRL